MNKKDPEKDTKQMKHIPNLFHPSDRLLFISNDK